MPAFWNKKHRLYLLLIFFMTMLTIFGSLLIPYGRSGLLLFILFLVVSIVGLFAGTVISLGFALILLFITGSLFFWVSLTNDHLITNELPVLYFLIWMVGLLVFGLLSGIYSQGIHAVYRENELLKEQMRTLVAVDPVTGFDNKERMLLELEAEHSRARRYGSSYSFLVIKMNYFTQFYNLYGEQETTRLLNHISETVARFTRISDLKFRPEKNLFALLLTNTPIEDIHIVIAKLDKELTTFQLQNKKFVTLTFEYGYANFEEDQEDYKTVYELARNQVFADAT